MERVLSKKPIIIDEDVQVSLAELEEKNKAARQNQLWPAPVRQFYSQVLENAHVKKFVKRLSADQKAKLLSKLK